MVRFSHENDAVNFLIIYFFYLDYEFESSYRRFSY